MFSVFVDVVKRVGIFIIIGQTILNFGISKKYEKYMKLVVSFMVAAHIIFSFGTYLSPKGNIWQIWHSEEYLKEWNDNIQKLEKNIEKNKAEMDMKIEESIEKGEMYRKQNEKVSEYNIKIEKITLP